MASRRAWALLAMGLTSACGGESEPKSTAGSTGLLGLEPDTLLVGHMPEIWDPTPLELARVSDDDDVAVLRTQVEVLFRSTATAEDFERVVASVQGRPVAAVAGVSAVVLEIPDPGTLDELARVIEGLEADDAVGLVLRDEFSPPRALPSTEPTEGEHPHVDHHLAVGGHGVWNVRSAMGAPATVVIADWFGAGAPQGWDAELVDADIYDYPWAEADQERVDERGFICIGGCRPRPDVEPSRIHGYFVGGVVAASFGGDDTPSGRATGIHGETVRVRIADIVGSSQTAAHYRSLQLAQDADGLSVLNLSLAWPCEGSDSPECHDRARRQGGAWAAKVRQAGLEERLLIVVAAGNDDGTRTHPFMDTSTFTTAAAVRDDLVDVDGESIAPLRNTLTVGANQVWPTLYGEPPTTMCMAFFSYLGADVSSPGVDDYSTFNRDGAGFDTGTSFSAPQVAGLAAVVMSMRPDLSAPDVRERILRTAVPTPVLDDPDCSTYASPSPTIDAFATLLDLDVDIDTFAVRRALLDENGDGALSPGDLTSLLDQMQAADGALTFGRADLNGDGYTGGEAGRPFDLNADGTTTDRLEALIDGELLSFDESSVTDQDVLCYLAFSVVLGSPGAGQSAVEEACGVPDEPPEVHITRHAAVANATARAYTESDLFEDSLEDSVPVDFSSSGAADADFLSPYYEFHTSGAVTVDVTSVEAPEPGVLWRFSLGGSCVASASSVVQYVPSGDANGRCSGTSLVEVDIVDPVSFRVYGTTTLDAIGADGTDGVASAFTSVLIEARDKSSSVELDYSTIADGAGSFVIEGEGQLEPGSYYLRADFTGATVQGQDEVQLQSSNTTDVVLELGVFD